MRIMILEDEEDAKRFLGAILVEEGCTVLSPSSTKEAIRAAAEFDPQLVISDYHLSESLTGADLCEELRKVRPNLPVIVISGYPPEEVIKNTYQLHPVMYFEKPLDVEALIRYIKMLEMGI
jgi:DNA-binding NtrC family response regulator